MVGIRLKLATVCDVEYRMWNISPRIDLVISLWGCEDAHVTAESAHYTWCEAEQNAERIGWTSSGVRGDLRM
jgi:hypothetical protein